MSQVFPLRPFSFSPISLRRATLAVCCGLLCLFALPVWSAVNPNQASQAELETIRGIGPSMSARIVAERQKNGPFKSPQDFADACQGSVLKSSKHSKKLACRFLLQSCLSRTGQSKSCTMQSCPPFLNMATGPGFTRIGG